MTCNYCKKKGHIVTECYKLQNKKKNGQQNDKGKQNEDTINADVVEEKALGVLFATNDNSRSINEWILDSRCSYHITTEICSPHMILLKVELF